MVLFLARCIAFSLPALALALGVLAGKPASAADINVLLDEARLVKLPDRVSTIVIGNPLIADATVQAGGLLVITGKGYGATNLIALDRSGAVLLERSVEVQPPRGNVVVVYKGVDKESYSCTPHCDRRLTLGDGSTFFDAAAAQISARNALAQSGAVASK
jgi:hypothetical protein